MRDVLRLHSSRESGGDWSYMEKDLPGVILHDRLMTDAAIGARPIKKEHSYSLASEGDSMTDSPMSHEKIDDDMEDECYPSIQMNTSDDRLTEDSVEIKEEVTNIKDEYSETDSIQSSCPSSPQPQFVSSNEIHIDSEILTNTFLKQNGSHIVLTSPHSIIPQRINIPKFNIRLANGTTFHLPPTPPSCTSSDDSEDNTTISQPPSPSVRKLTKSVLPHHTSTRQPIHTPLISSQPKGSTGILILTEEEKRTLIAEGYSVPTRLPLTKAEEKSLKKIRRKIKNKISAQESRRKKKEYMDQLEKKVEILVTENSDYKRKIDTLEQSNVNLMGQLQKLQALVARTHPQIVKQVAK
ncbi:cyclic AMP response element-binding protein A-like isoform X2 [Sitophilus oryzae]|nr:cyclic AMP response element-binding protein A-like isoform X2 [Sitophilus oryzae]XP_030748872.1 cyclic AMP response element-binding protein A-like isoform X2 [Sitophilus oryzae]